MQSDLQQIRQMLKDRIGELCARLLPDGRREGRLWVAYNPHGDDPKKLPAFKVALNRDVGAWRDWRRCSERDGHRHDVIGLVAYCLNTDTAGALKWSRDWLGLRSMSREERERLRQDAARRREIDTAKAAKARQFKLAKAHDLFMAGAALGAGSAAERHALAYLRARGVPLEQVATLNPDTFRFCGQSEWWKGATWDNRDGRRWPSAPGPMFPAIHTAMRAATGVVTCCHCTFLDPLKPVKAPVAPPKLMFGEALGAVIEVAMGAELLPFWRATTARPLIIAEGIETALALAIAVPDVRVWAAGSLSGFGGAPVELACVSDITVARDNNHGNAQAQAQLAAALRKLEEADKPLTLMASHVGDDFNNLITGEDED